MTIVLVHGNPETEAIWDDLVPHLRDNHVVRLSPPGFGSAIPSGFDCSTDAYRDWLAGELGKLAQPIDLVGHDWGGGHVARIAMERPDLIRSWASDILGCFDPDYVWHDMARAWQTAKIGEQAIAQMFGMPPKVLAQRYEGLGMTSAIAQKVAAGANADMGRAILALYRSAGHAQPRDRPDTGSRQTWPGVDRDRRFLLRRRGARAAFCRTRRREDGRPGRGRSLVDVPAAEASG